jgi:hypothetical protein
MDAPGTRSNRLMVIGARDSDTAVVEQGEFSLLRSANFTDMMGWWHDTAS